MGPLRAFVSVTCDTLVITAGTLRARPAGWRQFTQRASRSAACLSRTHCSAPPGARDTQASGPCCGVSHVESPVSTQRVHAVMQFLPIQRLPGPCRLLPSQAGMPALGASVGHTCGPLASTGSGWGTQAGSGMGGQRGQGPFRPPRALWRGPPPCSAAPSGSGAGPHVACGRGSPAW